MTTRCPQCGSPLPANAPRSLCPECLLRQGLLTTSPAARASFEVPSVERLTPLFPQLEVLGLVGQGGMGAVYRARQKGLGRDVALKILPFQAASDPSFAERFIREAQSLARLSHPHIVTIYDFGETADLYYLVMEYVDGVNLRQVMEAGCEVNEALGIVPQICDALAYAHEQGIVHRDIKPENILVGRDGVVKIADFGLAKLLDPGRRDVTLTGYHDVLGTASYMAPEQVERPREVDHRADIYSLGVVFYELLTGELPLGRFDPPSYRAHLDQSLDEVVLRALEKEPNRRYQSAQEMRTRILTNASEGVRREESRPLPGQREPARRDPSRPGPRDQDHAPSRGRRLSLTALFGLFAIPVPVLLFIPSQMTVQPAEVGVQPQLWSPMIGSLLALVVFASPTLLGSVSISAIRKAPHALWGMGLAVFDALFYPLLFANGLIVALTSTSPDPGNTRGLIILVLIALDVIVYLAVCRAVSVRR